MNRSGDERVKMGPSSRPLQCNLLSNVPSSICALDLEWEPFPDGLFGLSQSLHPHPTPVTSLRPPSGRGEGGGGLCVIVCRQIIAPNSSPLQRRGAHARSLRFSLEDFLTEPFLLSSLSTFSLWSRTFIMVSLASVTWSITSLQRCMLPWGQTRKSPSSSRSKLSI